MTALQFNLGFGDMIMFFSNSMGFTEHTKDNENILHLNNLLRYYGAIKVGSTTVDNQNRTAIVHTKLCNLIDLTVIATARPDGTELYLGTRDLRNRYDLKQPVEHHTTYAPTKWGYRFACPELNDFSFSNDQIVRLIHDLSEIKHGCDDWLYYTESI